MTQNALLDIQRHIDETKGLGEPAHCAHCGAETEGDGYCELCAPFYPKSCPNCKTMRHISVGGVGDKVTAKCGICDHQWELPSSLWRQMKLFQRENSLKFYEAVDKKYVLVFVDTPELWVCNNQGIDEYAIIERWDCVPSINGIMAAALGECICKPNTDACPTCVALSRMTSDELPF